LTSLSTVNCEEDNNTIARTRAMLEAAEQAAQAEQQLTLNLQAQVHNLQAAASAAAVQLQQLLKLQAQVHNLQDAAAADAASPSQQLPSQPRTPLAQLLFLFDNSLSTLLTVKKTITLLPEHVPCWTPPSKPLNLSNS
jgi:hypothetical protein